MANETHIVNRKNAGIRQDVYLHTIYPHLSRAWLQKLIKMEHVLLNGRVESPKTIVNEGDEITVTLIEQPQITLEPQEISQEPKIIYENDDFVVLEKPAGLVVHPSFSSPGGTLVNWLLLKYPEIREVGEDTLRPGIVHRLDKETSGLMVICKKDSSFTHFKTAFKERKISKVYKALVKGEMGDKEGSIMFPISRDAKNPFKRKALDVTYPLPHGAREAETYWRVISMFNGYTLLELVPKTGRTHQIRVHCAASGHPIVGDSLYQGPKLDGLSRLFLHAYTLQFEGPDGKEYNFTSDLPAELEEVLKQLEE